jgi:uncharacterized protein
MMSAFQVYQAAFTAHLRHPSENSKPAGVSDQRMRVYRDIVFNNFFASVSTCFPVLLGILGKRRFTKLVRQCFFSQQFKSPLFQDIPGSFVDFLQSFALPEARLPDYTAQLAHYEWIELALSRQMDFEPVATLAEPMMTARAFLYCEPQLPAAHRLLHYDFPVHQLSKKQSTIAPAATYLLVYRTADFQIRFIQLNAATYQLLQQLQRQRKTTHHHLQDLAVSMPQLSPESVIHFGLETLYRLYKQQAISVNSP